jgi:hypothetical protein
MSHQFLGSMVVPLTVAFCKQSDPAKERPQQRHFDVRRSTGSHRRLHLLVLVFFL